jgi:predicted ATP-binding protein involved in virulence
MLKHPDKRVLSALAALEGNSNFETVKSWLEESLQDLYRDSTLTKDEILSRWKQGAAQAVDGFLTVSKNSQESLRKSR